jgi:coenzyme A diphosphatase NUDT7
VLILDNTLRPVLNADEVASLFSHPLRSFLSSDPPFPGDIETLEFEYHTTQDIPWEGDRTRRIRMHRFLTGREAGGTKPVYGLTACVARPLQRTFCADGPYSAIMIRVAAIGFAQRPLFDLMAPSQPTMAERMAWVLRHDETFREAARREGIEVDKGLRRWEQQQTKRESTAKL